jgi:hypothetical protein
MKVARNARCPCGSGKKSKQCCGAGEKVKQGIGMTVALLILAVAVLSGAVLAVFNLVTDQPGGAQQASSSPGAQAAPGSGSPVPP